MSGIRLLWSGATTHYYGKARSTKPLFFRLPGLLQIMMMMMMLVPFQHHRNTKNGHPEVSSKLLLHKEGKYCDSLVNEACKSHNWILSTWHFFSLQDDYKCVYSTHFSYVYILLQNVETSWLDRALNKPGISKVSSISWQLHLKKMTPSSLSLMIKRTMCQMGANYTPFILSIISCCAKVVAFFTTARKSRAVVVTTARKSQKPCSSGNYCTQKPCNSGFYCTGFACWRTQEYRQ
jgi:hypothetical protein